MAATAQVLLLVSRFSMCLGAICKSCPVKKKKRIPFGYSHNNCHCKSVRLGNLLTAPLLATSLSHPRFLPLPYHSFSSIPFFLSVFPSPPWGSLGLPGAPSQPQNGGLTCAARKMCGPWASLGLSVAPRGSVAVPKKSSKVL